MNLGLLITLRRDESTSYFRHNLLNLIRLGGNTLFLASGYFQEIITYKSGVTTTYSILDDELLSEIRSNTGIKTICVTGCMNSSSKNFQAFLSKLRREWGGTILVGTPIKNSTKWHAKIAVILNENDSGDDPISAIVGSSNLTRPAYGEYGSWNHECDVVLWDNGIVQKANDVFKFREMNKDDYIYFDKITDGSNEKERMKKLLEEIRKNVEFTPFNKISDEL